MASTKRQSDPDLISGMGTSIEETLYDAFYEFSFFRAAALLEKLAPEKEALGKALEPEKEPVRFSVNPGFSFPASDIAGLKKDRENGRADMAVAFMGLIGPSGLLPDWYNQLAMDRIKKKDHTFTDFLNLFHHRLITLFYLAWKKQRFPENYIPGAGDRLSRYLLSLAGLGTSGMVGLLGLPRESLTFYAGLLSLPVASATGIEAAIEYFSGAPTRVQQFVEREVPLEDADCTRLGAANASLGLDAVCGSRVKECQTKFRVNLGPVSYRDYRRFIPSGDLLGPVFSLTRFMVGVEFEFELRIFLKKEDVPGCRLGEPGPERACLGWTTWTASPEHRFDKDQYITFQEADLRQVKKSAPPPGREKSQV